MSVLSEYTRILLQRTRDSILYSTNLAQPVNDDDDDDDDEDNDPASMFFSVPGVSVHRVQESIPLTDSLALRDGGIRHGGGGALQDVNEADYDEYVDEDGQRNVNGYSVGNIGYSDYSYSSRVSEMPSDMEELPTPSAIYLDVPPPVPSSYPNKHSLSESLLPTAAAIPSGITTVRPKRKFRDPIFALLYALTMVTFLITGIVLLCITTSTSLETASRKTVFDTIRNSAGMLAGMILFSMAVGALWILVLRAFAKYIVWGTIVAVPAIMFGMFIWTLAESFHGGTLHGGMNSQDIV
ncbi:hypothetical protein BC938DRAFT_475587 [Jimgerdemannia flammicorona]|uniref:Uncharacterized protein n=1 Tax=Jimgerdemannia flammicorona TaxID=994334 RepID=A0A433PRW3_9FUNG|nr:hypothetical protein BC938DRAFT_475587 [Jimgerdemannia flammicorona]